MYIEYIDTRTSIFMILIPNLAINIAKFTIFTTIFQIILCQFYYKTSKITIIILK